MFGSGADPVSEDFVKTGRGDRSGKNPFAPGIVPGILCLSPNIKAHAGGVHELHRATEDGK